MKCIETLARVDVLCVDKTGTITENEMKVTGFVPLDGYDDVLYQQYSGNSQFTSNEWWTGMSVKTYISISDNASVTSTSGSSGLGWGANAYGSVLDMTGG